MARRKGVSVRQRRVSAELRAWRIKRGLSCKDVATALGWSESKVSRMETGERGLYEDDVSAILGFLRVPAEIRQELMNLVRSGVERNWQEISNAAPISMLLRDLIRFEAEVTTIYGFEPLLMPGLVQTAGYARTMMRNATTRPHHEIEGKVAVRLNRQQVLDRANPPRLHLIIEEMVLRRTMDDPVMMVGQLQHLLAVSAKHHITIQVLPFDLEAAVVMQGQLIIIEFPDQPTLCYEESCTTTAFLEDELYISRARRAWKKLSTAALSQEDSRQLIAEVASQLTKTRGRTDVKNVPGPTLAFPAASWDLFRHQAENIM